MPPDRDTQLADLDARERYAHLCWCFEFRLRGDATSVIDHNTENRNHDEDLGGFSRENVVQDAPFLKPPVWASKRVSLKAVIVRTRHDG